MTTDLRATDKRLDEHLDCLKEMSKKYQEGYKAGALAMREEAAKVAFDFDGGSVHRAYDWVAVKSGIGHKIKENPIPSPAPEP